MTAAARAGARPRSSTRFARLAGRHGIGQGGDRAAGRRRDGERPPGGWPVGRMERTDRDSADAARPARTRGRLGAALVGLAVGLGLAAATFFGVRALDRAPPRRVQAPPAPAEAPADTAPADDAATALPLDRIEGLAALGDTTACAWGKNALACTADGGSSWTPFGELPDRILAVVLQEGEVRAATADGTVWAVAPGAAPTIRSAPPADLGVVDAAGRGGEVFLLAHRYDRPTDPLRLPRVIATAVLALGADGRLESRASLPGWAGERLLVQPDGELTIWAPFDTKAQRSRDGGRTFRPVPRNERVGAEYGGLLATIERRIEPARQGRPARSMSTLLLSPDHGATWNVALETEGELVVQFAAAGDGIAVSRAEGTVYRSRDGGRFEPVLDDDRLADAVDAARLGARWLVVTSTGIALRLP